VPLLVDTSATDLLAGVAEGDVIVTVGLADQPFIADAHVADFAVLQRDDALHVVGRDQLRLTRQPSVDGARRLFSVAWEPATGRRIAEGSVAAAAAAAAFDRGALAASAQLLGVSQRLIEITADYARQRHQFGKPIGSFQAVKHHLADALLALELARPVVYRAAWSVAQRAKEAGLHVSMAKAYASEAADKASRVALQVHGAMGYTWECDVQLWMKRGWALGAAWGDPAWHRRRVATAVLARPRGA
jgi:alkylation response protein AidB-like acyl-CoA dehydrogenase